jgi:hypothetical protein
LRTDRSGEPALKPTHGGGVMYIGIGTLLLIIILLIVLL